jgi:hypothetical protein
VTERQGEQGDQEGKASRTSGEENMRVKCDWLLLVFLGGVACTDATPEAHGVVMDSLATVVLAEPDTEPVTQTLAPFHARDGSWYVTDGKGDRILHFSSAGTFLGSLGRHGQGPGEFEGLGQVFELGMDTIAATDWSLRRVSFFVHGQHLDSMVTLPSQPMSATVRGNFVWFGGVNPASMTAQLRWDRASGQIRAMIPVPADFQEGSPLVGIFTGVVVVPWTDSILVTVGGYPWLRTYTPAGEPLDSFLVPVRLRRGVPLELAERLAKAPDFPAMFASASALPAAADIGDGWLALVYLDQDYDLQRGILNPRSFLTLVNRTSHRACVDVPIPASGDVTAWGAFGGDTLYMLDRRITDAGGLTTTITSYQLHPDSCPAEAVMEF